VHLDAHFDFIDARNGITWGHGSPMRRASEMAHVKGITTLGPHNMASSARRTTRRRKPMGRMSPYSRWERVYVSIDIDSFDPSIGPGTATIRHGGFTHCEAKDLLREVARRF
jgi:agmatinase